MIFTSTIQWLNIIIVVIKFSAYACNCLPSNIDLSKALDSSLHNLEKSIMINVKQSTIQRVKQTITIIGIATKYLNVGKLNTVD